MYTYQVRLVDLRCLCKTPLRVEVIVRVYLSVHLVKSHCFYETFLKLNRLTMYTYPNRLINSRCLYYTILEVVAIVCVYLPSPPSQLALLVRDYP